MSKAVNVTDPTLPARHGGPQAVAPEDEAVTRAQPRPQPGQGSQGVLQEAALTQLKKEN